MKCLETIDFHIERLKKEGVIFNFEIKSIQNIDTTLGILEMSFTSQLTNIRNDLAKTLKDTNLFSNNRINICPEARLLDDWPLQSVTFDEFRYDADVREGLKNKEFLANPVFQITIDESILRTLRTEKGVGFFRQSFDFRKFPFDTQKLLIRIETGVPLTDMGYCFSVKRRFIPMVMTKTTRTDGRTIATGQTTLRNIVPDRTLRPRPELPFQIFRNMALLQLRLFFALLRFVDGLLIRCA